MIFRHRVYPLENEISESNGRSPLTKVIFLDDEGEERRDAIVAEAISLDIRGDYGFFLEFEYINERNIHNERQEFIWCGNIFQITIKSKEDVVIIQDMTDSEGMEYRIERDQWVEALEDWKKFYLTEMGFLEFSSVQLSHVLGVLLLVFDKIYDIRFIHKQMFTESIKQCAMRYGVTIPTLYAECKNVTGVSKIEEFYELSEKYFAEQDKMLISKISSQYPFIHDVENVFKVRFGI